MTDIKELRRDFFTNAIAADLLSLCLGARLGGGISRDVFVWLPDPKLVAKVETDGGSFQNVNEWNVWQRCGNVLGIHNWLAPCVSISSCGIILLQKRTEPLIRSKWPKKVPAFLTDLKPDNFGLIDDKPVCHDYGYNMFIENGMTTRMRKTDWEGY